MQLKPVYLAVTREGLDIALELAAKDQGDVWCGANAISEAEYELHSGPPLSRFNYSLSGVGAQVLHSALETIEEHHPGRVVLVEGKNPNQSFQPILFGGV